MKNPRRPVKLEKNNMMETEVEGERIISHAVEKEMMMVMMVLVVLVVAIIRNGIENAAWQDV